MAAKGLHPTDPVQVVVEAAASRAAQLEREARQPFTILNERTPTAQVEAFKERQRSEAAHIRAAIVAVLEARRDA